MLIREYVLNALLIFRSALEKLQYVHVCECVWVNVGAFTRLWGVCVCVRVCVHIYVHICVSMFFSLKSQRCLDLSMGSKTSNWLHFLLHAYVMAGFDFAVIQNSIILPRYVLDIVVVALACNCMIVALQINLTLIGLQPRIIIRPISSTPRKKTSSVIGNVEGSILCIRN